MGDSSLFLETSAQTSVQCKLHPVVIWSILDHYLRRPAGQERVIGTLLGINFDGLIEIRSCFPVPHTEKENVAVDTEFHKTMLDLHQKAHPKEVIIGWYSTGSEIDADSILIHHNFYEAECQSLPLIHLTVETSLVKPNLSVRAYVAQTVGFDAAKPLATFFLPVSLEIVTFEAEKVGIDLLMKARTSGQAPVGGGVQPVVSELKSLEMSIQRVLEMLEDVTQYVEKVVSGTIKGDPKIGRLLLDTVASLPKVDPEAFDQMFNAGLQDLLMSVYLANLTRTQLILSEKLQTLL